MSQRAVDGIVVGADSPLLEASSTKLLVVFITWGKRQWDVVCCTELSAVVQVLVLHTIEIPMTAPQNLPLRSRLSSGAWLTNRTKQLGNIVNPPPRVKRKRVNKTESTVCVGEHNNTG